MEKRLEEQKREEQQLHQELLDRQTHELRRAQSMKELKDQETIMVSVVCVCRSVSNMRRVTYCRKRYTLLIFTLYVVGKRYTVRSQCVRHVLWYLYCCFFFFICVVGSAIKLC